MEFIINLLYAVAANIYDGVSAGSSSSGGETPNP